MTTNTNINNQVMAEIANEAMVSATVTEETQANVAVTEDGKQYSTRQHKGYSQVQMNTVYRHCKNKDLFIAKPVLEKMYSWAGQYEVEATPEMEELRQAACKAVSCVFIGNYKVAQAKVRFIESVLKKMNTETAAA